jgi:hypothetical protein
MRFVVIVVVALFGVCAASLAQKSDSDIAEAREKLKGRLQPAIKHDFTLDDYNTFYAMTLRMQPVGNDLAVFMKNPPMQGGLDAATRTQTCIIQVAGTFAGVESAFNHISTLIALAARMVDPEDLFLVTGVLRIDVSGFLTRVKHYQSMLDSTVSKCWQDGATVAKGQEITRIFKEATALVESVATRLGVGPQ